MKQTLLSTNIITKKKVSLWHEQHTLGRSFDRNLISKRNSLIWTTEFILFMNYFHIFPTESSLYNVSNVLLLKKKSCIFCYKFRDKLSFILYTNQLMLVHRLYENNIMSGTFVVYIICHNAEWKFSYQLHWYVFLWILPVYFIVRLWSGLVLWVSYA